MVNRSRRRNWARTLAESTVPYVMFRGEWIEVDTKEIRQVLRYMKKEEEQYMPLSEWLHLAADEGEDSAWKGLSVFGAESDGMSLLSCSMDRCFAVLSLVRFRQNCMVN